MSDSARAILSKFVDQLEQQPDRARRVTAKPPPFENLAEREAFEAGIGEAMRLGAIEVEYGKRGAGHLIQRIILLDHRPLYRMLGRVPLADRVAAASAAMRAVLPDPSPEMAALFADIEAGWAAGKQPCGFGVDDRGVADFVRALYAVLRRDPDDASDLRTYSRAQTGDSKLIERHRGAISGYLRRSGRFPGSMSDAEVFAAIGLEKFPQPVLIAGAIAVGDTRLDGLPYIGLPHEAIAGLRPLGAIRSVLSIENLASFNRHVREARRDGDVVVYTAGFPSRAVLQALKVAFSWCPGGCLHWGDIDPSGVEIALYIARATSVELRPHLMSSEIARRHGTAAESAKRLDASGTAFAEIAEALAGEGACWVEQEAIDPVAPVQDPSA